MESSFIYLDNNATTVIDPQVFQSMLPYFQNLYGNPNSQHDIGKATHAGLSKVSDQIYHALNLDFNDTLIMTSCATESINTVHMSFLDSFLKNPQGPKKIISSQLEHSATKESLRYLAEFGVEIIYIPNETYTFSLEDFLKVYIPNETLLVSLSFVNHETGVIHPIKQIAQICQQNNTPIHCDATQAVGKLPIEFSSLNVNYLSFSGHKLHGPKGIGALILKNNSSLTPLIRGGNQMGGFRSGTLNVPSIIGFGEAVYIACKNIDTNIKHIKNLKNTLETFLKTIPNCLIRGKELPRVDNTIFFSIKGIDTDYLLWYLNKNNIAVSTGSACTSKQMSNNSSEDLGIRVSFSKLNTLDEVNLLIQSLQNYLNNQK